MKNITLLDYNPEERLGMINAVDTGTATAIITDDNVLSQLQIKPIVSYK